MNTEELTVSPSQAVHLIAKFNRLYRVIGDRHSRSLAFRLACGGLVADAMNEITDELTRLGEAQGV